MTGRLPKMYEPWTVCCVTKSTEHVMAKMTQTGCTVFTLLKHTSNWDDLAALSVSATPRLIAAIFLLFCSFFSCMALKYHKKKLIVSFVWIISVCFVIFLQLYRISSTYREIINILTCSLSKNCSSLCF